MVIEASLVEILHDGKLLLIRGSRGVSKGKWNGPGGKMENGETPEQCAIRETLEETGLTIRNPFYHGMLSFHDYGLEEIDFAVHLFSVTDFSGDLKESEEGELRWFGMDALPVEDMWKDDQYWMPHMLKMEKFNAEFYFDGKGGNITKHEINVIGK